MGDEKPGPDSIRAGECEQHEPLVRRVLAPNPSPYTFTGTQTWIVGAGSDVAVIDPGPTGSGMSIGDPPDANGTGHVDAILRAVEGQRVAAILCRSEEHTSELQSLMRISYAVFCFKNKTQTHKNT